MESSVETDTDYRLEVRRFFTIQVSRYLASRSCGQFSGPPERDAVLAMIQDAWVELRASGVLNGLGRRALDTVYHTTLIFFPTFAADSCLNHIPVDFAGRRRLETCGIRRPAGHSMDRRF